MGGEVSNAPENTLPVPDVSSCYTDKVLQHRWQGDIFNTQDFSDLPNSLYGGIEFWMLMNRTCHMVEGEGRNIKIPRLVFCPVLHLEKILNKGKNPKSIRNQISNLIKGESEHLAFLPKCNRLNIGLASEHVVDFGAVLTREISACPKADLKIAQLSSPFVEHIMQRFARYYATFGYDDSAIRAKSYIDALEEKYSPK